MEILAFTGSAVADLEGWSDAALLELAGTVIARLARTPLSAAVDDEALRAGVVALQRCESAVHAEKLRRIAEVDAREAYRGARHRSTPDWIAGACGLAQGDARREARTADALSRMPATARRLADGDITAGHVQAAARGLDDLDRTAAQREHAAGDDVDAWRRAVDLAERTAAAFDGMVADTAAGGDRVALAREIAEWTNRAEPDAIEARERRALAKRGLYVADDRDRDGLWDIRVRATDIAKAQLLAAVDPLARPESADDKRTLGQRRHDALATLARQACDRGDLPTMAAQRPHLITITTRNPDGTTSSRVDGVGPVSPSTAALVACDAETTRLAVTPEGVIWDVGKANGDPSAAQRKAVIARDRTCVGCGAAASRCQIHHVRWRSQGGRTTVDNLALVCWSCHHGLHHLGWTMTRHTDGRYAVTK